MMTAFQLRKHLAADHGLELRGLGYAALILIHQDDHRADCDHSHDDRQAGHLGGDIGQLFYLVILFLFILILLRVLRLI